jgi:transcriptional regulator with XRE-family HTH domain
LNPHKDSFSPDAFVERLREIRKVTGLTGASIAQHGGITKQTFSGYLHTGRLPSACVLANWVAKLGINANWLLTGEGPMLLEQAGQMAKDSVGEAVETPAQAEANCGALAAAVE